MLPGGHGGAGEVGPGAGVASATSACMAARQPQATGLVVAPGRRLAVCSLWWPISAGPGEANLNEDGRRTARARSPGDSDTRDI
jgi:hypothetical protein